MSVHTGRHTVHRTEATACNEGDAEMRIDWLLRERLSEGNSPVGVFKVWLCLCKENTTIKST